MAQVSFYNTDYTGSGKSFMSVSSQLQSKSQSLSSPKTSWMESEELLKKNTGHEITACSCLNRAVRNLRGAAQPLVLSLPSRHPTASWGHTLGSITLARNNDACNYQDLWWDKPEMRDPGMAEQFPGSTSSKSQNCSTAPAVISCPGENSNDR